MNTSVWISLPFFSISHRLNILECYQPGSFKIAPGWIFSHHNARACSFQAWPAGASTRLSVDGLELMWIATQLDSLTIRFMVRSECGCGYSRRPVNFLKHRQAVMFIIWSISYFNNIWISGSRRLQRLMESDTKAVSWPFYAGLHRTNMEARTSKFSIWV